MLSSMRHCCRQVRGSVLIDIIGRLPGSREWDLEPTSRNPIKHTVPEVTAEMSGKEAVNERIGGRIERCQALDERCHGNHRLGLGDVTVDLKQIKDDVRRPAKNEYCVYRNKKKKNISNLLRHLLIDDLWIRTKDDDECHLDRFDFGSRDDAPRARSAALLVLVQHGRSHSSSCVKSTSEAKTKRPEKKSV